VTTQGLDRGVAVIDDQANRVIVLEPRGTDLARRYVPIGQHVLTTRVTLDQRRLFVLSRGGDVASGSTEPASLTRIDVDGGDARIDLGSSTPSALTLDPEGRYVAIYGATATTTDVAENPNQLLLVDLEAPAGASAVVSRTLRSFGGKIQRVTFTSALHFSTGAMRLLIVETDSDLALLPLDHIHDADAAPEITVRLSDGSSATSRGPASVVYDDGDPTKDDDAHIGVRLQNDTSVALLTLGAKTAQAAAQPFSVALNLADAGGTVTDLAFVTTDTGRRLAALVPSAHSAVLVEPDTGITQAVDVAEPFTTFTLVTPTGGTTDTALMLGAPRALAFWSLGSIGTASYRSVEVLSVPSASSTLDYVPSLTPNKYRVVRSASDAQFFVLDVERRTLAPIVTATQTQLLPAPDGSRVWAYRTSSNSIARVPFPDMSPQVIPLPLTVDALFDVSTDDPSHRALLAFHAAGQGALTVLDANAPTQTPPTVYPGLLLEGL
jgi:hypothetical protein